MGIACDVRWVSMVDVTSRTARLCLPRLQFGRRPLRDEPLEYVSAGPLKKGQ